MFAGAMLVGVLAALGLPELVVNELTEEGDDGSSGPGAAADPDPGEDPGALLEVEDSHEFLAGGVPGVCVIAPDFRPGEDVLNLRVPGEVDEVLVRAAAGGDPASISYAWADETVVVQFAGLDEVPVEDVLVLIDGEGGGIPLAALATADEGGALLPDDPETAAEPGNGNVDGGYAVLPDDSDEPAQPGQGGDGVALPPNDPSEPASAATDAGSAPVVISDFEPGEDLLRITVDPACSGEVTMELSDDGTDVLVRVGGDLVAVLENGVGADLTDLHVEVKQDVFPAGGGTVA